MKTLSSKLISNVFFTAFWIFVAWLPIHASAATTFTLQTANNTTGNQAYSGVGVEFAVNSPILVSALGIFDSNQDGISALPTDPLSAYLFTSTGSVMASMTFDSTSQGTFDPTSGYWFKPITPVTLTPGTYVLAGYGWTGNDLEHNCFIGGVCETFNNGGGIVAFVDSRFGGGNDPAGTFPTNLSSAISTNLDYNSAANMQFAAVPTPAAIWLFGSALAGLIGLGRRKI